MQLVEEALAEAARLKKARTKNSPPRPFRVLDLGAGDLIYDEVDLGQGGIDGLHDLLTSRCDNAATN